MLPWPAPADLKLLWVPLLLLLVGTGFAGSWEEGRDAFGRQDWKSATVLLGKYLQEKPDDEQAPSAAFLRGVAFYQLADFRSSLDAFQKLERTWPRSVYAKKLPYWKGTAALAAGQYAVAERELVAQSRYPEEELFATRALLNLALARVAQGRGNTAIEALKAFTASSREPSLLAQAWVIWGDEDRKADRVEEALVHYQRGREANPGDTWDLASRTRAVELLASSGRFTEARSLLEDSALLFPRESDRWDDRRVIVARGLNDTTGLKAALEARWARENNPKNKQQLALNRARTSEDEGKPEPAWWLKASQGPDASLGGAAIQRYAYLLETSGRIGDAARALEVWAATVPAGSITEEVRNRAALDWGQANDAAAARKVWDGLITEFPASVRMPGWLLNRGRLLLEGGDTTRALADFSRLLKEFPQAKEGPEARYQTGLVYLKRQEPARAEAWFYGLVQDLKSGDLYQRALLARGVSFVNSGQTELARGSLQRLLRETPEGPWTGDAWAALGRNALQVRLFDEAIEAFSRAQETQTNPADQASALWSLAEALGSRGSVDAASQAYTRYAEVYANQPKSSEAHYRQGSVYTTAKEWEKALVVWTGAVTHLRGEVLAQTREGMATALLRLGRMQEAWDQLLMLEAAVPSPEAWYRWGQTATTLGLSDWAVKAFQELLVRHPGSSVAEAALPRAAGALLGGGRAEEALVRFAEYFRKFGRQSAAAPVARAAAAAAQSFPQTLEALTKEAKGWNLAPEVATEFSLAWALSRLDSETDVAQKELQDLSQSAPWTSQRSEALTLLGRWHLARGRLGEARTALEAAAGLGDDLSVFKARWALAQVTEKDGDRTGGARQREVAEKSAGPGVPLEFRVQLLREAAEAWSQAGRPDDAQRVQKRISTLGF